MGSILPEGELVQSAGGWSKRRAAALFKAQAAKDAYHVNAVRGAHLNVQRIKDRLVSASKDMVDDLELALMAAEDALKAATERLEAHERGEEPGKAPEAPEKPVEPVVPAPPPPSEEPPPPPGEESDDPKKGKPKK